VYYPISYSRFDPGPELTELLNNVILAQNQTTQSVQRNTDTMVSQFSDLILLLKENVNTIVDAITINTGILSSISSFIAGQYESLDQELEALTYKTEVVKVDPVVQTEVTKVDVTVKSELTKVDSGVTIGADITKVESGVTFFVVNDPLHELYCIVPISEDQPPLPVNIKEVGGVANTAYLPVDIEQVVGKAATFAEVDNFGSPSHALATVGMGLNEDLQNFSFNLTVDGVQEVQLNAYSSTTLRSLTCTSDGKLNTN